MVKKEMTKELREWIRKYIGEKEKEYTKKEKELLEEADKIIEERDYYQIFRALRIYKKIAPEKLRFIANKLLFKGMIDDAIEAFRLAGYSDEQIKSIVRAGTYRRGSDEILANIVEYKLTYSKGKKGKCK
ncbi:MAG: hypothetical protein N3G19_01435 [Candidatus Pacearchaeota archaeon]|nr:hypothetical protein [Candidatus Pacearchaeota archaeon]